jgi:hypothetical protein
VSRSLAEFPVGGVAGRRLLEGREHLFLEEACLNPASAVPQRRGQLELLIYRVRVVGAYGSDEMTHELVKAVDLLLHHAALSVMGGQPL